ncbi:MAG: PilZ domain-containing protein [Acidobacteria bacterium]|nr:PilZ domain-containing protein [Acidobacteriota bacterium]
MADAFLERRHTPRVPVTDDRDLAFPQALTVRVVDISNSGVLLVSPQKLAVGQRARLQANLGREALSVEVEVRRVVDGLQEGFGRGRYRVGAVFVQPDEVARRSVQQFLRDDVA